MRIPNLIFIAFVLLVVIFNLVIFNLFLFEYRGDKIYEARLEKKDLELAQSEKNNLLLSYQMKDFEQSVALALPAAKDQNYAQSQLASILRVPASHPPMDLSGAKFESGKIEFKNKKYLEAIKDFQEIIDHYPASEHKAEAFFMISESLFLSKNYSECLNTINKMLELFPAHDLTGFALLRLAAINEMNGRSEVAKEVYKTIKTNFNHSYLLSEVEKKEKHLQAKGL